MECPEYKYQVIAIEPIPYQRTRAYIIVGGPEGVHLTPEGTAKTYISKSSAEGIAAIFSSNPEIAERASKETI